MKKIPLEGIAEELMSAIQYEFGQTSKPVLVSGKYETLIKYMENNGYIISLETGTGNILVIPNNKQKV